MDCDLRRAQIHNRLGVSREPGLSDVFLHHSRAESLVRPTTTTNLFASRRGSCPPNPPAVLGRRDVGVFFDSLRNSFDWMLVDSPPLASVTDGYLLARHADTVLLVVQFNRVDKRLVKRSLAALRKASNGVLGVVLNALDMKSDRYGGYYYTSRRPERRRQTRWAGGRRMMGIPRGGSRHRSGDDRPSPPRSPVRRSR